MHSASISVKEASISSTLHVPNNHSLNETCRFYFSNGIIIFVNTSYTWQKRAVKGA